MPWRAQIFGAATRHLLQVAVGGEENWDFEDESGVLAWKRSYLVRRSDRSGIGRIV